MSEPESSSMYVASASPSKKQRSGQERRESSFRQGEFLRRAESILEFATSFPLFFMRVDVLITFMQRALCCRCGDDRVGGQK